MNPFNDFQLKLKDSEQAIVSQQSYEHVFIQLQTDYKWGEGWSTDENRVAFSEDVFKKLEGMGYKLQQEDLESGYYLMTNDGDKTHLHVHPAELTGYIKKEDLDGIKEVLDAAKSVESYEVKHEQPVCELTDKQYQKILDRNASRIAEIVATSYPRHDLQPEVAAKDFVTACRIYRYGDKMGYRFQDSTSNQ